MGQDHIEEERYTEQNTLEEETNPILNSELESEYLKKSKKDAAKNFRGIECNQKYWKWN